MVHHLKSKIFPALSIRHTDKIRFFLLTLLEVWTFGINLYWSYKTITFGGMAN